MFFKIKFRADAMKHERKVETAGVINDDVMEDVFRISSYEPRTVLWPNQICSHLVVSTTFTKNLTGGLSGIFKHPFQGCSLEFDGHR